MRSGSLEAGGGRFHDPLPAAWTLGYDLAVRRRVAGLTQQALGDAIGYSRAAICHAEAGRRRRPRRFWEAIDAALSAGSHFTDAYDDLPRPGSPPPPGAMPAARGLPLSHPPVQKKRNRRPVVNNALSPRHRLVGSALRGYRQATGCTLAEVAAAMSLDLSGLSRIETGQRGPTPAGLRALLARYGVGDAAAAALLALSGLRPRDGWQAGYSGVLAGPYLDFLAAESAASRILLHAPDQVPPLLQTPGYALAAARADPSAAAAEDLTATAALARQQSTLHDNAIPVEVVLGEAALLRADRAVLRAQLEHLAALAGACPHLTIRLLPFSAGPGPAAGAGEFTILEFGDPAEFAMLHLAGPDGGAIPDDPGAAPAYQRAFAHLRKHALSADETARRLHG
jgi:transcriptional regulator with XRE-family HTH domain